MSRTNPYKKKRRSASRTLLMYGEGLGEEMFLKYLRGLYSRDSGVAVTIRNGKGGTASSIISNAVNEPGAYDRRIVILDNDKSEQEMNRARIEAQQKEVELLENSPCLEATLLAILRPGQSFSGKTSAWCKTELDGYGKIFSKATLDTQRVNIPELNTLIYLMEQ